MDVTSLPLVSVVIPSYNHARYLGRALQSLIDQTYDNWEAIIVDNNSTDDTENVIAKFTDKRITLLKINNMGVIAASRNMGIRAAKGEWIAFLDSDDWWTPEKLFSCLHVAKNGVDLIYHDLDIVREPEVLSHNERTKSRRLKPPVFLDLLLNGNTIANSSVVVRKGLLDRIGGIDESRDMVGAEDYHAWLRIARITEKFAYLPVAYGSYLVHDKGVSNKDMTPVVKRAVIDFYHLLDDKQISNVEGNVRYAKGVYHYSKGFYSEAIDDFFFAFRHGTLITIMKSAAMISFSGIRLQFRC